MNEKVLMPPIIREMQIKTTMAARMATSKKTSTYTKQSRESPKSTDVVWDWQSVQ